MRRHWRSALLVAALVAVLGALGGLLVVLPGRAHDGRAAAEPLLPAPAPPTAVLAGAPAGAPEPTAAGLARSLAAALEAPALGGHLAAVVTDVTSGAPLLDLRGDALVTPASTAKLTTAVAVLHSRPADARLVTRTVAGARPGDVLLVGDGDTTLAGPAAHPGYPAFARLTDLAAQTVRSLRARGVTRVRVEVDATRYAGPTTAPGWKPSYVRSGNVAPVTALSVDGGRRKPDDGDPHTTEPRASDPPLAAGQALAALLGRAGLTVTGPVVRASAPAGAQQLGAVSSPPLPVLVEWMLAHSDNDLAESLARQVALARGRPGTFAGGSAAVADVLHELGVTGAHLVDGSGLSVRDRVTPRLLTRLLALATEPAHPELRPLLSGLPIAGFLGTLDARFDTRLSRGGAGLVRAKTGTLSGVSSLAGLVEDADGRLLAFAFVADGVPGVLDAEAALDRLAAGVAACGCR